MDATSTLCWYLELAYHFLSEFIRQASATTPAGKVVLAVPGVEHLMPLIFPSIARAAGDAIGRALHRVGVRAANVEQSWRSYAELTKPENRPAYGGTPSDDSVRQAVAMLKARGYHVTLYPFLLMDIPPDNELPALSGVGVQPAYPWRGRISAAAGDTGAQVAAIVSCPAIRTRRRSAFGTIWQAQPSATASRKLTCRRWASCFAR